MGTDPWLVTVKLEIRPQRSKRWRDNKSSRSAELRRDSNTREELSTLTLTTEERRVQTLDLERKSDHLDDLFSPLLTSFKPDDASAEDNHLPLILRTGGKVILNSSRIGFIVGMNKTRHVEILIILNPSGNT